MILAGDVGGTKTLLALFARRGGDLSLLREAALPSRDFPTFEAAIARFLADGPGGPIDAACFGVAGPVVDGRVTTTNLPWRLDERRLAAAIPAGRVRLLNDLVATGHGVLALPAASLCVGSASGSRSRSRSSSSRRDPRPAAARTRSHSRK